ncbi:MAG: prephenate dehydrogenase/arogenate dehydrogenase family protein [Alphaproteobacteria bacterium]|uniref:Prephenate dehydrogenase/arogenate dehydrogenase family protein n=1 Tax=Candidatus Nitrobium versatile TaxID=2884831 RepID=A0A953J2G8_9BACT|nr:prephenate dehydrogenase/arogenate dehydrogenase family protein [Candidatus Nitrobium versatile]
MSRISFGKTAVIGVGLLGASVALALRESGLCGMIHGYGRSEDNLRRAKERGIIDEYRLSAREACADADLVLLSTPVGVFKSMAEEIKEYLKEGALVTDVGSIKGKMVSALEELFSGRARYIGSHPIAGSDTSGIDEARADLFRAARCIVTPTERSDSSALESIVSLWETLGARVEIMDACRHDAIYGAVSHLPHLVAYALVNTIGTAGEDYIEYAGQGFRDTTRIAMSSPELWRDVSLHNRENLLRLMDLFGDALDTLRRRLEENDAAGLESEFSKARALRKKIEER